MEKTDKFLEHFGIKGMRWGVRKNSAISIDTTNSGTPKRQSLSDANKKKLLVGAAIAGGVLATAGAVEIVRLNHVVKATRVSRAMHVVNQRSQVESAAKWLNEGRITERMFDEIRNKSQDYSREDILKAYKAEGTFLNDLWPKVSKTWDKSRVQRPAGYYD